jgi:hypothetical protein
MLAALYFLLAVTPSLAEDTPAPWACTKLAWTTEPRVLDRRKAREAFGEELAGKLCRSGCEKGLFVAGGRFTCWTRLGLEKRRPVSFPELKLLQRVAKMSRHLDGPAPSARALPSGTRRAHRIESVYGADSLDEEREDGKTGTLRIVSQATIATGPASELSMEVASEEVDTSDATGLNERLSSLKYSFELRPDDASNEFVVEYEGSIVAESPVGGRLFSFGSRLVNVKGKAARKFEKYRDMAMEALTREILEQQEEQRQD